MMVVVVFDKTYRPLPWSSHLVFLPFKAKYVTKLRLEGKVVWYLFSDIRIGTVFSIAMCREHDKDGCTVIKLFY